VEKLSVFGAFRFSEFRIRDCVPVLRRGEERVSEHVSEKEERKIFSSHVIRRSDNKVSETTSL
jgi:hypothetical protein